MPHCGVASNGGGGPAVRSLNAAYKFNANEATNFQKDARILRVFVFYYAINFIGKNKLQLLHHHSFVPCKSFTKKRLTMMGLGPTIINRDKGIQAANG